MLSGKDEELDEKQLADFYAYPAHPGRPWLRANFVSTLDGAAQGPDRRSGSLASAADRRVLALLRALSDVIVVGAGTARAERYGPARIRADHAGIRSSLGLAPTPPIAVVTRTLRVPEKLLDDPRTIILTGRSAPETELARLSEHVDVAVCGGPWADPQAILDALRARGHRNILTEGGPTLFAELAAADLIDELCLTITPAVIAGPAMRVTHGRQLNGPVGFRPAGLLEDDGYLFGRWLRTEERDSA